MTSPAMSDLAALADELERRVFEMGRSPRPENDAISLGFYIAGQVQALLSALRASRPEPAADAVEGAVAEIGAVLTSGLCSDCPPVGYPTDETRCLPCPRRSAALAAAQSPTNTAGD